MSVQIYVTAAKAKAAGKIQTLSGEIMTDGLGLRLQDVFQDISKSVQGVIEDEAELTIELSGSVEVSGKGEAKFLFINLGGGASATNAFKAIFKSKIKPPK